MTSSQKRTLLVINLPLVHVAAALNSLHPPLSFSFTTTSVVLPVHQRCIDSSVYPGVCRFFTGRATAMASRQ